MPKLTVALSKETSDWWEQQSLEQQKAYLEQHPQSHRKLTAEPGKEKAGEPPKEEATKTAKPLAPGKPLAEYAKAKDEADVTPEKILAKFKPDDVDEMQAKAKKALSAPSTDKHPPYFDPTTNDYTPERKAMHHKIIQQFLSEEVMTNARPAEGEKPTFIVLGGRGGSGKSAFTEGEPPKANEFDPKKYLIMDADKIKGLLDPPYEGWNANQVHEESSYLFDHIVDMAKKMGLNIVSDATLKSDKMGPVLEDLQNNGYDIEGHYMFLPRQKAAERACGRYLHNGKDDRGRLVPPEVILGNTKNEENFDKLKTYFKKWSCYDNDQPKGTPPQLIDRGERKAAESRSSAMSKLTISLSGLSDIVSTSADDASENDQWENDPYLTNNKARMGMVAKNALESMYALGIKPEKVANLEFRKEYQKWIKANKVGK